MKVTVHLVAITRKEYETEIEVPDGTSDVKLDAIMEKVWDDTDVDEFEENEAYFERGENYWLNTVEK